MVSRAPLGLSGLVAAVQQWPRREMLPQKRQFQFGKHDKAWAVNIEKWWRRAAGYSRLNATSSPPMTRRNSEIQMKKFDSERQTVERDKSTVKSTRRPSTARPVVIVERTREVRPPPWNKNAPVNINEEFIEVFYWTQSRYNYPGQLERYKKNLCYCCADCPACQADANRRTSDRHRPLSQGRTVSGLSDIARTGRPPFNNGYYNTSGTLRTSYA